VTNTVKSQISVHNFNNDLTNTTDRSADVRMTSRNSWLSQFKVMVVWVVTLYSDVGGY